jgi:two-component system response regulator MprA
MSAREEPSTNNAIKVLVADDSETILLLLRTRLEMEGYDVQTAADGQEVLDRMSAGGYQPDLLLLDAMMPRKSGLDALRELRQVGVRIPALIVSAHQDRIEPGSAEDPGVDGYLTKPVDFDELFVRIGELTAGGG